MVFEDGVEEVPLHHRQRFANGADGAGTAVPVEAEPGVRSSNRMKQRQILVFDAASGRVEGAAGFVEARRQLRGTSENIGIGHH